MPFAVGDVISRKTSSISYAKLPDLVLPTSSNISIASAVITIVAASQSVTIATGAVIVVALMSTSGWDSIRSGISGKSSSHGVKATVAKVQIEKHQGGGIAIGYKHEIEGIGTYIYFFS